MITFKQFIAESFDRPYKTNVIYNEDKKMVFTFHDDEQIGYKVEFCVGYYGEVDINLLSNGKRGEAKMSPWLTGNAKSPLRVYATIGHHLQEFVLERRDIVKSISMEYVQNRTRPVYERFGKRIAKQLGGTSATKYGKIIITL